MKVLVVLFDENNKWQKEVLAAGKTAEGLCRDFFETAQFLPAGIETSEIVCLSASDIHCGSELLAKIHHLAKESSSDAVIYSYADLPFLNRTLTNELLKTHFEYKCEYTFYEGYPYGFTPEIIDSGTIGILSELAKGSQAEEGRKPVCRETIFNLIKCDINSFEVESEISETDWRLLRLRFCCESKDTFLQCRNLLSSFDGDFNNFDAEKISEAASKNAGVLKTIPSFYNIQISSARDLKPLYEAGFSSESSEEAASFMNLENFSLFCKKISDYSEKTVLNIGFGGEALLNPDFYAIVKEALKYEGLSVFFETSALAFTEDSIITLKNIVLQAAERTNGWQPLMVAVRLDGVSAPVYAKMNGTSEENFMKAVENTKKLCAALPSMVYPQFTRMNQNEEELETFFRFWNEKSNASGGKLIIQKYNDYSGLLPSCKPADFSPVERNVCWHIRRDMTVMADGSLFACPNMAAVFADSKNKSVKDSGAYEKCLGNVFESDLSELFDKSRDLVSDHINKNYCQCCGKCDEYYTFNF